MHRHPAAFGLIAFAALSVGPAYAEGQAGSKEGTAAAPATADDKKAERVVCRKLIVSGSRMPKRVCGTKVEWEEQTKRNAQELHDGQQESDRRSFHQPDGRGN